jgi:hypothetical protein
VRYFVFDRYQNALLRKKITPDQRAATARFARERARRLAAVA